MIEVGRLCVKTAGRDAGKKCVVVSVLDGNFVLIDGETRRRKCNSLHLEPLDRVLEIKNDAPHSDVVSAFKKLGIELVEAKSKKKSVRPRTLRRSKLAQKPSATAEKLEKPVAKAPVKKPVEKVVDAEVVKSEKTGAVEKKPRSVKPAKIAPEKKNE